MFTSVHPFALLHEKAMAHDDDYNDQMTWIAMSPMKIYAIATTFAPINIT